MTQNKTLSKLELSIEAQAKKLLELKTRKAKIDARIRSKQKSENKRAETRRLVLLGAYLNDRMKASKDTPATFSVGGVGFDSWLVREDERALFGLAALGPAASSST